MATRCQGLVATGLLIAGAVFTLWAMELNWADVGSFGSGAHTCYDPRKEGELELLRMERAEAKQRLADQERFTAPQSSLPQPHPAAGI
jgi:hypothetical protein